MLKRGWRVLWKAGVAFTQDQAGRLGAALAFFTALSLAPFFIFSVTLAGYILDQDRVHVEVMRHVGSLIGAPGLQVTEMLFANALEAYSSQSGIFTTGIGVIVLLFAASAVMHELRDALNKIFRALPQEQPLYKVVLERFISITLVFSLGFLLAVSLMFSAALSAFTASVSTRLSLSPALLTTLDVLFNIVLMTVLFGLLYKYLPNTRLRWREVGLGAFLTAIIFTAGKWSIGLFLGNSLLASAYGAAGSLVVFLLWVFFTAQLFFYGAEVVKVYHDEAEARAETHSEAETEAALSL